MRTLQITLKFNIIGPTLALVTLLSACSSIQTKKHTPPPTIDPNSIQKLIDQAQTDGKLPAIGALIKLHGRTIYFNTQGQRSLQHQPRVQLSDLWHLGSETKAMTAFLIAQAVEQGKIHYDTPLNQLLPSIPTLHPGHQSLTLGNLLTHTTQIPDLAELEDGLALKRISQSDLPLTLQRTKLIEAALQAKPVDSSDQTSTRQAPFRYTNINYIILGHILEEIYQQPWEQIITTRLFTPLNMHSCGFGVAGEPTETQPSQPWPHMLVNQHLLGVLPKAKLDNPPLVGPAGTVHCNLTDWAQFASEVIALWNQKSLLIKNKETREQYFKTFQGQFYTLGGWMREDEEFKTPTFMHDGSNTFNYATALIAPAQNTIILITTNTATHEAKSALNTLKQQLFKLIFLMK